MNKIDDKNLFENEDKELVNLLQTATLMKSSDEFVASALKRWSVTRRYSRNPPRPLKAPLYMMGTICFILIISTVLSYPNTLTKVGFNISENIRISIDPWYSYSIVLLLLVPMTWFHVASMKPKHSP